MGGGSSIRLARAGGPSSALVQEGRHVAAPVVPPAAAKRAFGLPQASRDDICVLDLVEAADALRAMATVTAESRQPVQQLVYRHSCGLGREGHHYRARVVARCHITRAAELLEAFGIVAA